MHQAQTRSPLPRLSAFLLALAWFAAAPSTHAQGEDGVQMPTRKRPNIIVLLADDLNAADLGSGAPPWLRTPNLDALAAEGTRFERAFVTTALCSPSRASLLTGRYARHHRILSNNEEFSDRLPTFASLLGQSGYLTAYVGKWHMGNSGGPRPGFDYTASYGGHGKVRNSPFLVGTTSTELVRTKGWVDDVATDYAIEFLRSSRRRPLLLYLGFKAPHTPRIPDARHAKLYAEAELPSQPTPLRFPPYPTRTELEVLAAAAGKELNEYAPPADWLDTWQGPRLPETELKNGSGHGEDLRNYYRLVTGMDENVGRLMETLRELDLDRETIVVFTSDNGLMNGRLGIYGKRSPYDEALAVPLLVRLPAAYRAPRVERSDKLVLNVDLAPTLLDYAGVPAPAELAGRSLRPLLEPDAPAGPASSAPWRDRFVAEFEHTSTSALPSALALRTEQWKLITYAARPDWTELFDVQRDPEEAHDLARDPDYAETLSILRRSLAEENAQIGPPDDFVPKRGRFR